MMPAHPERRQFRDVLGVRHGCLKQRKSIRKLCLLGVPNPTSHSRALLYVTHRMRGHPQYGGDRLSLRG